MSTVLDITPTSSFPIAKGEEQVYELSFVKELDGNTVNAVAMTITDNNGTDVTADYGGGTSESNGIILLGIIGYNVGVFTILLVITCNEFLPNGTTPIELYAQMRLTVK
jgi:hypothetical protein